MKKIRAWRIIFGICCLVYMAWMIHVGGNEFDRINGQYSAIVDELDAEKIRSAALEELIAECRGSSAAGVARQDAACLSWPEQVMAAREKKVEERLVRAKERAFIKLVLFYAGFVILFLLTPPFLLYLLIVGIIKVFATVRIVR